MINTRKLVGIIYEKGLSQRKVAKRMGMAEKTFYGKMKRGVFDSDEMEQMIRILDIRNPLAVFFPDLDL